MKLYLSSYQFGNEPHKLVELFSSNKKIGIIANALDQFKDLERRKASEEKQILALQNLGLQAEILDLRDYFDNENLLREKLEALGGVWVLGGNTFVLRLAYKFSGFDKILQDFSSSDNKKDFVYAGFSAGCVVIQEKLDGFELVDDPEGAKEAYSSEAIFDGIGLLHYDFVPHTNEDHPESARIKEVLKYLDENNIEYKKFRDGEVLLLET